MYERSERKELRILFTPEAYERLERQAQLLDVPASTWVRSLVMEKVTAFEAATANAQALVKMDGLFKQLSLEFTSSVDDYRKK